MKTRIFVRPSNRQTFMGSTPGTLRGLSGWVVSVETAKRVLVQVRTVGFLRAVELTSRCRDRYPGAEIRFPKDLKNIEVFQ